MKAAYTLEPRPGVVLPVPKGTLPLKIDGVLVEWRVDEEDNLVAAVMQIQGLKMSFTSEGRIDPAPMELQEHAYLMAIYVANQIYLQTSMDVIDPEQVLLGAPEVFPESPDEEAEFKRTPRTVWKSFRIGWSVRGKLDPASYGALYDHSSAYSYYADAMRTTSPFQQIELLYKVVEYFFSEDGAALDAAVSSHVALHDLRFTPALIKELRELRNRIVHPRARRGHANPERVKDLREAHAHVKDLRELVVLLFKHPTF